MRGFTTAGASPVPSLSTFETETAERSEKPPRHTSACVGPVHHMSSMPNVHAMKTRGSGASSTSLQADIQMGRPRH